MNIEEARKIAQEKLKELEADIGELLAFTATEPEYVNGEWQFCYNTKEAVETGNPLTGLAGNGPICIDKAGNVRQAGSA